MSTVAERRAEPDRRKAVRGGRRPYDKPGFAPLVLVVGNGQDPDAESEAILGGLRFAVAPAAGFPEALQVANAVHPDLVVAPPETAARLRAEKAIGVPIIEAPAGLGSDALIDRIRETIRRQTG